MSGNPTGSYKRLEHSGEASNYYIIPKHSLAVPVVDSLAGRKYSEYTIQTELGLLGDYESSGKIIDYPVVNHRHLLLHFREYRIVPLLKVITVCKPRKLFSGHDQLAMSKQRKRHFELMAVDAKLAKDAAMREAEIDIEL